MSATTIDAFSDTQLFGGFTIDQLKPAFDTVKNKEHWKNPIELILPSDCDQHLISSAVIFYTGSVPDFTRQHDGRWHVYADGYYLTVGA